MNRPILAIGRSFPPPRPWDKPRERQARGSAACLALVTIEIVGQMKGANRASGLPGRNRFAKPPPAVPPKAGPPRPGDPPPAPARPGRGPPRFPRPSARTKRPLAPKCPRPAEGRAQSGPRSAFACKRRDRKPANSRGLVAPGPFPRELRLERRTANPNTVFCRRQTTFAHPVP